MVSVELLNCERQVSDMVRAENDRLRADNERLRQEAGELRRYGDRGCTAMADDELARLRALEQQSDT